jgi:5-methylthioadenosine/S-adenosylhomocysteine deaminase
VTLASANGITKLYTGLLRNPERPDDDRLPAAQANIANPDTGGASAYLQKLAGSKSYLQHLSEGTDATAREWFQRLQIDETTWAVNDVLCGIHCTALNLDDFRILAERGATMVWSPLSNYLLYGDTADIAAAKESGIAISLGSDWAPSGSKNVLGELKVASLASRQRGDVFTPRELVQMITVNPARSLKWDSLLGSIEPGKLADLVVVAGLSGNPYELLLRARESSVTLVVIGGVPRVGQPQLMRRFWDVSLHDADWIDDIRVGSTRRQLFVEAPDDLLDGLKLSAATDTLRDAMARLPELARDVDRALEGDGAGIGGGLALGGETFRVVPDFEDEDAHFAAMHDASLAAKPYAFWVTEPMALDPITVVDDRLFLRNLQQAGNLPEFVKRGLPGLYGKSMPIPDEG